MVQRIELLSLEPQCHQFLVFFPAVTASTVCLSVIHHLQISTVDISAPALCMPTDMLEFDIEHLNLAEHPLILVSKHFVAFLKQFVLLLKCNGVAAVLVVHPSYNLNNDEQLTEKGR